jgi:peroxiredoxin
MTRPAAFLICALALIACSRPEPARLNVGDMAPTFQSHRPDGAPIHFPAAFAGKAVVIRFWADWCHYCAPEMQAIERVYQRRRAEGLEVIAVNAGQDADAVKSFVAKIDVTYPALLDEKATIARQYGVVGLPTTFFVDRKGIVRAKIVGEADDAIFDRHAAELLQ